MHCIYCVPYAECVTVFPWIICKAWKKTKPKTPKLINFKCFWHVSRLLKELHCPFDVSTLLISPCICKRWKTVFEMLNDANLWHLTVCSEQIFVTISAHKRSQNCRNFSQILFSLVKIHFIIWWVFAFVQFFFFPLMLSNISNHLLN